MATSKPSLFTWATNAATRTDPGTAKKATGWTTNESPGSKVFNWLQNHFTAAINHNNEHGVNAWDNSTDYANGALCYHDGIVYARSAAGAGGSAPSVASSPWEAAIVPSLSGNVTLNIPSDYPTLQDAFNAARHWNNNGFLIFLNIEAGHSVSSGLDCRRGNYGHFVIDSADAEVTVAGNFPNTSFLKVADGIGPRLATTINMSGLGVHGLDIQRAKGSVSSGAGVKNAGGTGLLAIEGSSVLASSAIFTGSGTFGIRALTASNIVFRAGDSSNSGNVNVSSEQGSVIDADNSTATGSSTVGMQANSATINAASSSASGTSEDYAVINGGTIRAASTGGSKNITINTLQSQGIIFA